MVCFAEPVVSSVHELPNYCKDDNLRRSLYYSDDEIKQFKAEIRHMLKRRVFFDLKNSVVHNVSPTAVRGDLQQSRQLFYTPTELEQLEQDFVTSVKLEHGVKKWSEDDQKPIALLVLERAKLREKYVASIRNKLVKLKVSSTGPTYRSHLEEGSSFSSDYPSSPSSTRSNTPKRCPVSSSRNVTTSTRTETSCSSPDSVSSSDTTSDTSPNRITTEPRSSSESTSIEVTTRNATRKPRPSRERGRGPRGLGLPRQGSGIAVASRRSSIEIAKRHAERKGNQQSMQRQHGRTSAMAA